MWKHGQTHILPSENPETRARVSTPTPFPSLKDTFKGQNKQSLYVLTSPSAFRSSCIFKSSIHFICKTFVELCYQPSPHVLDRVTLARAPNANLGQAHSKQTRVQAGRLLRRCIPPDLHTSCTARWWAAGICDRTWGCHTARTHEAPHSQSISSKVLWLTTTFFPMRGESVLCVKFLA